MDFKLFATVFSTIFVAELGDKTQLATLLYASDASHPKLTVFAASAAALVLTSALGVLAGSFVAEHVNPKLIRGVWVHRCRGLGLAFSRVGPPNCARSLQMVSAQRS
jgi:putative Ca2+/H+ antiporter (TMEM165/GDT1 family)